MGERDLFFGRCPFDRLLLLLLLLLLLSCRDGDLLALRLRFRRGEDAADGIVVHVSSIGGSLMTLYSSPANARGRRTEWYLPFFFSPFFHNLLHANERVEHRGLRLF